MNPRWIVVALALAAPSSSALAQSIDLGGLAPVGASATSRMIQVVAALTVLSVAPGLLITVTSFTRFAIALSFLRTGLGIQSTPANLVIISLALFMTFFVMTPTFNKSWDDGLKPLMDNAISETEALQKISQPFRDFMADHVREKDLRLFEELTAQKAPAGKAQLDFQTLIPAFMISELRRGFEIGFLIVLPFLVIDVIVSIMIMAMGMMMLPPTTISLPIKVLFFVLIDGWHLLVGSLLRSYS